MKIIIIKDLICSNCTARHFADQKLKKDDMYTTENMLAGGGNLKQCVMTTIVCVF